MTAFVSKYFTLEEVTASQTAARLGINNQPDAEQLTHIKYAAMCMDKLRDALGSPITISSWLRVPELNRAIAGSSPTSAHQYGFGIDCNVKGMTPYDLCRAAFMHLNGQHILFDQIIYEFGSWMHVSFDPRGRRQTLTIFSGGKGYLPGILTEKQYRG